MRAQLEKNIQYTKIRIRLYNKKCHTDWKITKGRGCVLGREKCYGGEYTTQEYQQEACFGYVAVFVGEEWEEWEEVGCAWVLWQVCG